MSKALSMLQKRKSTSERADQYFKSIRRNIEISLIFDLERKKEALEGKIFDLENFDLETDHNAGRSAMTQDQAEARFVELINANYELELLTLEIDSKKEIFAKYFGNEESNK